MSPAPVRRPAPAFDLFNVYFERLYDPTMHVVFTFNGEIDAGALREAAVRLVASDPYLRSRFADEREGLPAWEEIPEGEGARAFVLVPAGEGVSLPAGLCGLPGDSGRSGVPTGPGRTLRPEHRPDPCALLR
ncbi:condensation domain-containing protein [Methanoculleus bourgensis MS2]|uniref:Condensation domain-containing protein n=1 Tax=Methanoculleus bourgensis (strain ATCC 43281 / DSM 3045 / OCM 15 / MS2) TaxID=1201294 RepID=W6PQG3_METBM|nr:condensation domain-containing protein [Methanoculleus bourgensis]CDM26130.1 condensation domain-containing protein [Methanoculleus bourgensis MS2]